MAQYTILLVDYEPRSVEQLVGPLEQAGYLVDVAKDGVAGAERFHSLKPDLALLEAMLPKKHGFELCQELKRTPHGKKTPIVIITGVYKGRKYRTQAMHQYGCDAYLEKPITAEQLLATIGQLLGRGATALPAAPTPVAASGSAGRRGTVEDEITDRLDSILADEGPVTEPEVFRGPAVPAGGSKVPRASFGAGAVLRFESPRRSQAVRLSPAARSPVVRGGAQPALFSRADVEEDVRGIAMPDGDSDLADLSLGTAGAADDTEEAAGRRYHWIAIVAIVAFGATLLVLLV